MNPWSKMEHILKDSIKVLNTFAQDVIDERRQKPNTEASDLLTRYLDMTDENGKPFSDTYLRDIIMNFMCVSYHILSARVIASFCVGWRLVCIITQIIWGCEVLLGVTRPQQH